MDSSYKSKEKEENEGSFEHYESLPFLQYQSIPKGSSHEDVKGLAQGVGVIHAAAWVGIGGAIAGGILSSKLDLEGLVAAGIIFGSAIGGMFGTIAVAGIGMSLYDSHIEKRNKRNIS